MDESGVKGFDVRSWQAIFAPAGVPAAVVEQLHRELTGVLRTSEVRQRLAQLDITQVDMGPAALGTFQRGEIAKWAAIVKSANIAPN